MNGMTVGMDSDSIDDENFFDSCEVSSNDDDDDEEFFEASRMSLVSASIKRIYSIAPTPTPSSSSPSIILPSYDMWIAEPGDVSERRKRLLQGMGLASNRDLLRLATSKVVRAISIKIDPDPPPEEESKSEEPQPLPQPQPQAPSLRAIVLVRSRSDSDIDVFSNKTKQRKEEIIGPISKNKLTRTLSGQLVPSTRACQYAVKLYPENEKHAANNTAAQCVITDDAFGSFFLIKNLDTGKDFIVKEFNEQGMWNKLNDVQTGKQLTMEEFEKSVGYSPVVKEMMRRVSRNVGMDSKRARHNSQLSKGFRNSTRKGSALLKSIKGAASGLLVEKEDENRPSQTDRKTAKCMSQWIEAHQHGKSYKEITALHLCQEIKAHEGSIWTMRFSSDCRFLASAGEDRMVHVWEVHECEVMPPNSGSEAVDHTGCNRIEISSMPPEMRRKGRRSGKAEPLPDYVKLPETMLTLSEKPLCTFEGHKDEVLDLSWSKSQLLLSSSMDKTVKMWDLETKSCLKTFAHKDYVTCIQFNPVAENFFISGSLDGKVRIWNISDHRVADWTDVHEMVTAASYTPDGQGAIVGTQQGSCRMYSTDDSRLEHRMDIQKKKNSQSKKFPAFQSQAKKIPGFQSPAPIGKITGFQFAPWDQSQVLITSADSRIGIYNGSDVIQKFKGYRNTSSQISASFSPDGKHIISASEDSQVYMWKVDDSKISGSSKKKTRVTVQAHEHFQCKDVSFAITWPGSSKIEPPVVDLHSKKQAKRPTALPPTKPNPTSATPEETDSSNTTSLPPLPKKRDGSQEEIESCTEDDSAQLSDAESISENISSSSSSSGHTIQATTWGVVIVTASLEGEIRVYQNLGLPLKVARQAYLF